MAIFPSRQKWIWELLRRNSNYRLDFLILKALRDEVMRLPGSDNIKGILGRMVVTDRSLVGEGTSNQDYIDLGNWKEEVPDGVRKLPRVRELLPYLIQFHRAVSSELVDPLGPVYSPDLDYAGQHLALGKAIHRHVTDEHPDFLLPLLIDIRWPFRRIHEELDAAVNETRSSLGITGMRAERRGSGRLDENAVWARRIRLWDDHPRKGPAPHGWYRDHIKNEFPVLAANAEKAAPYERAGIRKDAAKRLREDIAVAERAVRMCYQSPHVYIYALEIVGAKRPKPGSLRRLIDKITSRVTSKSLR